MIQIGYRYDIRRLLLLYFHADMLINTHCAKEKFGFLFVYTPVLYDREHGTEPAILSSRTICAANIKVLPLKAMYSALYRPHCQDAEKVKFLQSAERGYFRLHLERKDYRETGDDFIPLNPKHLENAVLFSI